MPSWLKYGLIAISPIAVTVGLWLGKGQEVIAVVTTIYVIVVFLQLEVMQRQYRLLEAERRELMEREQRSLPQLHFTEVRLSRTREIDNARGVELGPALYINCFVKNVGGSVAKLVEPVLTASARKSADSRWQPVPDWVPLGLRWSLDEINAVRGEPTQARVLVPNGPYLFDLGKISTYRTPLRLEMLTLLRPAAQEMEHGPGEYCFEVTLYSENASPKSAWYLVTVDRDARVPDPMQVAQLPEPPWTET